MNRKDEIAQAVAAGLKIHRSRVRVRYEIPFTDVVQIRWPWWRAIVPGWRKRRMALCGDVIRHLDSLSLLCMFSRFEFDDEARTHDRSVAT